MMIKNALSLFKICNDLKLDSTFIALSCLTTWVIDGRNDFLSAGGAQKSIFSKEKCISILGRAAAGRLSGETSRREEKRKFTGQQTQTE